MVVQIYEFQYNILVLVFSIRFVVQKSIKAPFLIDHVKLQNGRRTDKKAIFRRGRIQ